MKYALLSLNNVPINNCYAYFAQNLHSYLPRDMYTKGKPYKQGTYHSSMNIEAYLA